MTAIYQSLIAFFLMVIVGWLAYLAGWYDAKDSQ